MVPVLPILEPWRPFHLGRADEGIMRIGKVPILEFLSKSELSMGYPDFECQDVAESEYFASSTNHLTQSGSYLPKGFAVVRLILL